MRVFFNKEQSDSLALLNIMIHRIKQLNQKINPEKATAADMSLFNKSLASKISSQCSEFIINLYQISSLRYCAEILKKIKKIKKITQHLCMKDSPPEKQDHRYPLGS